MKDILNFDKNGRPRTAEEIADLCADADIAFNADGSSRTAGEIEKIKFIRVLIKNPEYFDWVKSEQERKAQDFELDLEINACLSSAKADFVLPNYVKC